MVKQLGETFGSEVTAAGLGGKPLSWRDTDVSIEGRSKLTQTENQTLDGVVAAHNPNAKLKNVVPTSDFIARFTNPEYLALGRQRAADLAASRVGYSKNWDIVVTSDTVDLNKQKSQNLKADLVAAGVLTQQRADVIFS